jgi:hypothetical protein
MKTHTHKGGDKGPLSSLLSLVSIFSSLFPSFPPNPVTVVDRLSHSHVPIASKKTLPIKAGCWSQHRSLLARARCRCPSRHKASNQPTYKKTKIAPEPPSLPPPHSLFWLLFVSQDPPQKRRERRWNIKKQTPQHNPKTVKSDQSTNTPLYPRTFWV